MGGFLFWLAIVICVVALVLLFFPFRFRVEFEAGEHGCRALFFFFKKKIWTGEKTWGKKSKESDDSLDKDVDDDVAEPEFVATASAKPIEKKTAPAEEKKVEPVENASPAREVQIEKTVAGDVPAEKVETPKAEPPKTELPKSEPPKTETPKTSEPPAPEPEPVQETTEKKEKPKLTDEQFWTIILTPDLDARAFRCVKSLLAIIVNLFNIKFVDCFVEGIRSDYETMGYGAALNGIFKSFPYLQAWDFRMDWCRDRELRAQGAIHARTNLCRFLYLLLVTLVYAGILFLLFWRRRARVLKTGELPELGFIRKKIVGWMVEE